MQLVGSWYFIWVFVPLFIEGEMVCGLCIEIAMYCDSCNAGGTFAPFSGWLRLK